MTEAVWIIICAPLVAALLALLARGRSWERIPVGIAGVAIISAAIALLSLVDPSSPLRITSAHSWLSIPGAASLEVMPSMVVDAWAVWVTAVVSIVGGITLLYATGEQTSLRKLSPLCISIFAATMVVLAGDFLQLTFFWMLLGFSTCWLVGHDLSDRKTNNAVRKSAIVLQIGGCGLLWATFLIWSANGTLEIASVLESLSANELSNNATMVGIGLLVAATAICAQFPLLVWLPDAVDGPAPAAALMQTLCPGVAGIHLLVRCQPLLTGAPELMFATAIVGGLSALLAAYVCVTQTSLPRLLAFSSISHFGLMFLAVGTGTPQGVAAAGLHLAVHACCKSLMCLAKLDVAGQPRVSKVGFFIGLVGVSGLPLLSGFWSVTSLLSAVKEAGSIASTSDLSLWWSVLFWGAVVSLFLGSYGLTRGYLCLTHPSVPTEHPQVTNLQKMLLLLLAAGGLVLGAALQVQPNWLAEFLELNRSWNWQTDWQISTLCTVAVTGGALTAWIVLLTGSRDSGRISRVLRPLLPLSRRELFLNEVFFLGLTLPLRTISLLCRFVDWFLIDRVFVGLAGGLTRKLANSSRPLQNGLVQFYALVTVLVVGAVLVIALWTGGSEGLSVE